MKSRTHLRLLAAGVALFAIAAQDAPRSILPGDTPQAPSQPSPPPTLILPPPPPTSTPGPVTAPPSPGPEATPPAPVQGGLVQNPPPDPFATPAASNVDLARWGVLGPASGGYSDPVFAGSDGAFLAALMGRMVTPVPSRWGAITLARATASLSQMPEGVKAGDWTAARVRLLTRLGFVELAKRLIDPAPVDRYTPALYAAALETNLAAADLPANCALAVTGQSLSRAAEWRLAGAICASIEGDDIAAARAYDALRADKTVTGFDVSLAEYVASRLGGARAANIAWGEVDRLTPYRLGVAGAAGLEIPEDLAKASPLPMRAWLFRAAGVSDTTRASAVPVAAALGVASSSDFRDFYAALTERPDGVDVGGEIPGRLRVAFAGGLPDRLEALQALWKSDALGRYPAYVLTAEPAMRLPAVERFKDSAAELMRAAQAGGRLDRAMLWWPIAQGAGGDVEQGAWPQAVVSAASVDASAGRFRDWLSAERSRIGDARADARARLLYAALSGLGRTDSGYGALGTEIKFAPVDSAWTARIDSAAAAGRKGEVILLSGTGMQATSWLGVPPDHFRHIIAAYVRVGLSNEARLLAAEAMSRI